MNLKIAPFAVYEDDVVLSASWILTRRHPASCQGVPVLVYTPTKQAFRPNDMVNASQSYGGVQPAFSFVSRLVNLLPPKQQEKARKFLT